MNPTPWSASVGLNNTNPLDVQEADVVIVGGGITGLTTAYLLLAAGRQVVVLERDELGQGETHRTTAHLTQVIDLRLQELVDTFGLNQAQLVWQLGAKAIDQIETMAQEQNLACDFERIPGYLYSPRDSETDEAASLQSEAAMANKLGFDCEFMLSVPGLHRPGICYPRQARIHPTVYLQGLARRIVHQGGRIFEHAEVTNISDDPLVVTCGGNQIRCQHVIVATHVPLQGIKSFLPALLFQSKIYPYTSYAIEGLVPKRTIPDALYWDTANPYRYLRLNPRADGDGLIFGGEDHKTGQVEDTDNRFRRLQRQLEHIAPEAQIVHQWSGQVIETNDGLPYIGETAPGQFIATGFAGNGLTLGTVAAQMACDYVLGRQHPARELFSPHRQHIRGGTWDYLRENVSYPYYIAKDMVTPAEARNVAEIPPNCGKIVSIQGHSVACSRNADGDITMVSGICTHMGCVVRWNSAECTWDCPCHGSRFEPDGKVIAGPAESPLEAHQEHAAAR